MFLSFSLSLFLLTNLFILYVTPDTFAVFFYLFFSLLFCSVLFSEIYNVVQTFPQIADSVCVGQSNMDKSEERVVLFVKMKNDCDFDSNLVSLVSTAIREQLSPRHVPAVILPIEDIPVSSGC